MKRALALLILSCALTACSNTGNPYGTGNPGKGNLGGNPANPGAPGQDKDSTEVHSGGPNTSLMGNAWCAPYHNQGNEFQFRINFINPEDYDTRIYSLVNGGRGAEVAEWGTHGNYQLNGATLTLLDSRGQSSSYTVRLDPSDAVTGAKKLHLTDASGDAALDPCL